MPNLKTILAVLGFWVAIIFVVLILISFLAFTVVMWPMGGLDRL